MLSVQKQKRLLEVEFRVFGGIKHTFLRHTLNTLLCVLQNKTCVQTLQGHAANISSVAFHPELPIIMTGSEDGKFFRSRSLSWSSDSGQKALAFCDLELCAVTQKMTKYVDLFCDAFEWSCVL